MFLPKLSTMKTTMQLNMLLLLVFSSICSALNAQSTPVNRVPLMREGTRIVEASAHLTRADEHSPILIEIDRGERKDTDVFYALPNQRLAELEATYEKNPKSTFRILGDIFVHNNRNYLLVREATLLVDHAQRNHPVVIPVDPNKEQLTEADHDDSVASIVKKLEEATGSLTRSIRDAAEYPIDGNSGVREGTKIVARRCYLDRNDSGAWIAVFIADATGLSDPPCTILPGTQYGHLITWASTKDVATPVLLTGELLNYRGHGFLVLNSWRSVHTSDHLDN